MKRFEILKRTYVNEMGNNDKTIYTNIDQEDIFNILVVFTL